MKSPPEAIVQNTLAKSPDSFHQKIKCKSGRSHILCQHSSRQPSASLSRKSMEKQRYTIRPDFINLQPSLCLWQPYYKHHICHITTSQGAPYSLKISTHKGRHFQSLYSRNHFHLNQHILRQSLNCYAASGRLTGKVLAVNLVKGRKIAHVC